MDCLDIATTAGLVNTFLELEHPSFNRFPGQGIPFIHRVLARVYDLFTLTHVLTFHAIVPTSAYPLAFPTALAF